MPSPGAAPPGAGRLDRLLDARPVDHESGSGRSAGRLDPGRPGADAWSTGATGPGRGGSGRSSSPGKAESGTSSSGSSPSPSGPDGGDRIERRRSWPSGPIPPGARALRATIDPLRELPRRRQGGSGSGPTRPIGSKYDRPALLRQISSPSSSSSRTMSIPPGDPAGVAHIRMLADKSDLEVVLKECEEPGHQGPGRRGRVAPPQRNRSCPRPCSAT